VLGDLSERKVVLNLRVVLSLSGWFFGALGLLVTRRAYKERKRVEAALMAQDDSLA